MPARPNVPKVVQIVMFADLGGDLDVINRFFQQYTGAAGSLSDTGAAAWAAAVNGSWAAHIRSFQDPAYTLVHTTVTDLSTNVGGFGDAASGGAGTGAPPGLSAAAAFVMKCHVERRYRGGHPRQYLSGMLNADLASKQTWDPTFLANFVTAYTNFRAQAAAGCPAAIGPAVDVNVSFFQGFTNHTFPSGRVRPIPTLRAVPVVDVISSFEGNPKVGSQRRRNLQSL